MRTNAVLLSVAVITMALSGCKPTNQLTLPAPDMVEYELPCGNYDHDTPEYFTGLGTAENINEQSARDAALKAAKSMVREKVGGMAKGLSTDYSKTMRGNAAQTDVSSIIEGEIVTVINRMLNDSEKTCERNFRTNTGTYKAYIAITISKKELAQKTSSALDENDKLRMMYDREQFRKFMEAYMEGLKNQ